MTVLENIELKFKKKNKRKRSKLIHFCLRYAHLAYDFLLENLYNNTSSPDVCFNVIDSWQWWIFEYLPFNFVLNIVDSFLLEGTKVLYRFGISLLEHFYKSIVVIQSNNQQVVTLPIKPECMKEYCNGLTLTYEKLIKTAFGYRNMSRKGFFCMAST